MPVIKLTDQLKEDIKEFFAQCGNKTLVAQKFKISIPTVYRVLSGKVYIRSTRRVVPCRKGFFNEHQHENWLA